MVCLGVKFYLLNFFLVFSSIITFAQIGGGNSFDFVNLPTNARQVALGGINVSSNDKDVNAFLMNPALLNDSTDLHLSLSYFDYYADVNNTTLAFTNTLGKLGTFGLGIQYLNYGEFESFDNTGASLGTFQANDFALTIAHSHQVSNFTMGASVKFVQSNIESYQASGMLLDFGGAFVHPTKDLTVGLAFKNVGFAFSEFVEGQVYEMPLDVQLGVSFKPEKMPLRLSVTAHHLHQFDIAYDDPSDDNQVDAFGEPIDESVSFADKLARHFVIGGEFVLSRNINLRAGYNFLNRRELILENRQAMVGFSYGVMVRIKKFEIAYARSIQHIAGGTSNFTLIFDTKSIFKKKRVVN